VEQSDTLVGELTVEQMLSYTASLKLPASTTAGERQDRVEEVITRLDLHSCRNTIIGSNLLRGISGGQAKRVNIGLAMITRPRILFLVSMLQSVYCISIITVLSKCASTTDVYVYSLYSFFFRTNRRVDLIHELPMK